ncbi:MAG: hypothetical protein IKN49_03200 [Elusimicrobiaceae bacterium]|nr:hypothetical protein [Elusimicrobiaceae bacterium]
MKKLLLCCLCTLYTLPILCKTATNLSEVMPLLQAPVRTSAQNEQVLQLFITAKQPDLIFSTGASLVRIPPTSAQQTKLFRLLLREQEPLKQVFAAIILTAMGNNYAETTPLLQEAISSTDPALRAYAAAAYTILNPSDTSYAPYIVNLYIYDAAFAQRAMNLIAGNEKQLLKQLKSASQSTNAQIRSAAASWLADMGTEQAANVLLKMAKKETDTNAIVSVASALAKNRSWTLEPILKGLKTKPSAASASVYTLALGFMTGYAVEPLRQALQSTDENTRINAIRAATYMAGVLASPDAALYTSDKNFDIGLLKSLIAPITALSHYGSASVKPYAESALHQIAKLK